MLNTYLPSTQTRWCPQLPLPHVKPCYGNSELLRNNETFLPVTHLSHRALYCQQEWQEWATSELLVPPWSALHSSLLQEKKNLCLWQSLRWEAQISNTWAWPVFMGEWGSLGQWGSHSLLLWMAAASITHRMDLFSRRITSPNSRALHMCKKCVTCSRWHDKWQNMSWNLGL